MNIIRNGAEIELTSEELQEAWEAQHELNLKENLSEIMADYTDKENNAITFTEEEMEEAVGISAYYLEHEWDRGSSLTQAIEEVLEARVAPEE